MFAFSKKLSKKFLEFNFLFFCIKEIMQFQYKLKKKFWSPFAIELQKFSIFQSDTIIFQV